MNYRLTPEAFSDLQNIYEYIAEEQHQPNVAASVVTSIQNTLERVADNPLMGRKTNYLNTYQFSMAKLPFTLVYRIAGDMIHIITIFNETRHPDSKRYS